MSRPQVLVLAATVPWRREACEQMLESLSRQTLAPESVILHLDGFARGTPRPRVPATLPLGVRRFLRPRGVGNWWRSLDESHAGMLVACVGDDFVYPPRYLERLAAHQAEHGGAISWHGWSTDGRNCRFRAELPAATPLIRCGTALFLAEAHDLLGVAEHELADLFFHPRGHDEALVSCWLWARGVVMTRPAGTAGVTHLAVGWDPRATSIRDSSRKPALRRVLQRRYGWPDPRLRSDPRIAAAVAGEVQELLGSDGDASRRRPESRRRSAPRSRPRAS